MFSPKRTVLFTRKAVQLVNVAAFASLYNGKLCHLVGYLLENLLMVLLMCQFKHSSYDSGIYF